MDISLGILHIKLVPCLAPKVKSPSHRLCLLSGPTPACCHILPQTESIRDELSLQCKRFSLSAIAELLLV